MKRIIFLFLAALAHGAQAQTYSLPDLFALAEQNSKTIRIADDALSAAKETAENARAQRLPDIGVQLSLGYNGRGLITDRNFGNAQGIYIPEFANNFSLQVSQVIYAGGAITAGVKLGEQGQRMATLDVERNRQEVRFYIVGQYLDLCRTLNTLQVVEHNLALTDTLIANVMSRAGQGITLANDVTRHELMREQMRLQRTRLQDTYSILNHNLCQTVGLPEGTKIEPAADFGNPAGAVRSDESQWQSQAASNIGLRQAELSTEMAATKVKLARAARLPKLALVAEDHLDGPITIEIPNIDKNLNYWFVGVGVQYSLSSLWKTRHDVRRARFGQTEAADRHALAAEQVNTAVHAAHTDLLTAEAELHTCEKQVSLAEENYAVVFARYHNGIALLTDMLDAAQTRLSAEIALAQSRIKILYCQKKLEYLSSTL